MHLEWLNFPPSHIKKPLVLSKYQHSVFIAFVLTSKCSVGPEHRVINDLNIHVFSAKLNLAYLLQVIPGAFVHMERRQIIN